MSDQGEQTPEREAADYPTMACPMCGAEAPDLDGFGVLACAECGYCTHASVTGDICGLCGRCLLTL